MAKYMVQVTVTASCTYEVEVESSTEWKAEDEASGMFRDMLPDDFQVAKGYITDWETEAEQLTWECEECEKQITESESDRCDDMCESCFEIQKAEDAAFWQTHDRPNLAAIVTEAV